MGSLARDSINLQIEDLPFQSQRESFSSYSGAYDSPAKIDGVWPLVLKQFIDK